MLRISSPQASGDRLHTVYQLTGSLYKIVQFYRETPPLRLTRSQGQHYDHKLEASFSRSKRVLLELALCNDWDYFVTLTLDEGKVDRFNLDSWYSKFYEMIKYQTKTHGLSVKFVLVPERHKDGAWHAHGLFKGNMDLVSFDDLAAAGRPIPLNLLGNGYYNWPLYQERFGFCSFGLIRNHLAAGFYMTKYITKDLCNCVETVGKHLYYASQGLYRSNRLGSFVVRSDYIDSLLNNKYEFCATGIVQPSEGWYSEFVNDLIEAFPVPDLCPFSLLSSDSGSNPCEVEADQFAQCCFDLGSDLRFFSPG